jgi:hypothetical protein
MAVVLASILLQGSLSYAQLPNDTKPPVLSELQKKFKEFTQWLEEKMIKLKTTMHNLRPSVQQQQMKEKADESKAMMRQRMQESTQDQAEMRRQQEDARDQIDAMRQQQKIMMQSMPGR